MPALEMVWKVAYVTKDGEEVGFYELLVEGFEAIRLQRNITAAINFANGMKSGLEWMVENKRYFFPDDFAVTVEELQAWFEASDGIILGGTEIFAAASVEAASLFECLADAGLALAEAVAL